MSFVESAVPREPAVPTNEEITERVANWFKSKMADLGLDTGSKDDLRKQMLTALTASVRNHLGMGPSYPGETSPDKQLEAAYNAAGIENTYTNQIEDSYTTAQVASQIAPNRKIIHVPGA